MLLHPRGLTKSVIRGHELATGLRVTQDTERLAVVLSGGFEGVMILVSFGCVNIYLVVSNRRRWAARSNSYLDSNILSRP